MGFRNPASHWTEREIYSKQDSVWIDYYIIPLIPMEELPMYFIMHFYLEVTAEFSFLEIKKI